MNKNTLILLGLIIAFACGWSAPRNRYQLIHFDLAANRKQYDAVRMDTWTGEVQIILRMPDPTGGDYLCDYWATIPVKQDQKSALDTYNSVKSYAEKHPRK